MLKDKEILEDMELDVADRFAKWADAGIADDRIGKLLTQRVAMPYMYYLEAMGLK